MVLFSPVHAVVADWANELVCGASLSMDCCAIPTWLKYMISCPLVLIVFDITYPQMFRIELVSHAEEVEHRVVVNVSFESMFTSSLKRVHLIPISQ